MLNVKKTLTKVLEMLKTAKGDDGTWKTINANLVYTRKSGVVFVRTFASGSITLANNSWNNIGTIPYAPKTETNFVAIDRNNLKPMMGRITTAGVLSLYPEGGNCSYWVGDASFPIMGGVVNLLKNALCNIFAERGWSCA